MSIEEIDGIEEIGQLDEEFLYFKCNGRKGICDKFGNILINKLFDDIEHIDDTNLLIGHIDFYKNYIIYNDGNNLSLSKKTYYHYKSYDGYLVMIEKYINKFNNMITYYFSIIDKFGRELLRDKNIVISYLQEDMFLIKSNDLLYVYNALANQCFELNIKDYNDYNGGYMLQVINGKYRYLDKEGKVNFDIGYYDDVTSFHKTMPRCKYTAIVRDNKKREIRVIDNEGNKIISLSSKNYNIISTKYDLFIIENKKNNKYGVRDIKGNIIAEEIYESINIANNGICFCYKNSYIRDCYTIYGKKIKIDNSLSFISDNKYGSILLLEDNSNEDNPYSYINKDGKILFNGLTFKRANYMFSEDSRVIVTRKEASYSTNNPYEYDRFSVLDIEKEEVVFTYPKDNSFDYLDNLYTDDHNFYIGKLKDKDEYLKDEYLIIDKFGKQLFRLHSDELPIIKYDLIIVKLGSFKLIYSTDDLQYNVLTYEHQLNNGYVQDIKIIDSDLLLVTMPNDKRYLCPLKRINGKIIPEGIVDNIDISYEKGLTEKVKRRLLSR